MRNTSIDIREVKRRNRNENVFARPNGLRENADTAISVRGPGPARKKKEVPHQSRAGGRICIDVSLWRSSRVELTWWENVKYTRRDGMC